MCYTFFKYLLVLEYFKALLYILAETDAAIQSTIDYENINRNKKNGEFSYS